MSSYGSPLFAALKAEAPDAWSAYVSHAFVARLADGTLPRRAFLAYLAQDYLFLIHFARAWALAVVKSSRIDEMMPAAETVLSLVGEEMRLHVATCGAEGIDEAALAATQEAPATLAYTRFVIDAGLKGDLLDLLVALAPCVFGYGEIGARLAAETGGPPEDHPYHDWIATYAGTGYQAVCMNVANLLDTVMARRIGADPVASPRWPDLAATFATACRLEADFWTMGLEA